MKKKKQFKFYDKYFGRLTNKLFFSYMDKFTDFYDIVNEFCFLNNSYYMNKYTYQEKENLELLNNEENLTLAINKLSNHIDRIDFYLFVYNNLYNHINKNEELKKPFVDKHHDLMTRIAPFRNKYNYLMRNKTPLNIPVLYLISKNTFDEETFKRKEKQSSKYLFQTSKYFKKLKKELEEIKFAILFYKIKLINLIY